MKSTCTPYDLRCEFFTNPIGIDEPVPRLSWKLRDSRPGARQTAWQVCAASSAELLLSTPDLWDSGVARTGQSLDIEYHGTKLRSRDRVWWRVRVWDKDRKPSPWSRTAFFEMGLLKASDWTAQWIGADPGRGAEDRSSPYLRKDFVLRKSVSTARLYVTARGLFEAYVNGTRVGDDHFAPGWTDYNKRIPCHVYDVAGLLSPGGNAVGAILGDGWFCGHLGWNGDNGFYGNDPSLILQLEITYDDGARETIASGPGWKTSAGPIRSSDIYNGETYDARLELGDWSATGYDDSSWRPAKTLDPPKARIVSRRSLPVRSQEEVKARALQAPKPGVWIFDLGQNMVGWARVKLRGKAGDTVRLRFGEMLNGDNTLYTANLRRAKATDSYICKGFGEEVWAPRFTFHGFRYVELTGLRGAPELSDVTGVVLHSEIPRTGTFECSDPFVNRLQRNIVWGQKGNFLEVPTDCPQRDERLGWTGDAQVFARTACFNRDVAAFFEKWCIDIADEQLADGCVPHIIPNVIPAGAGSAAWSDAAVICPWTIYRCYGDKRILQRQYGSMVRWVEWRARKARGHIDETPGFGDWLAIDIAEGEPGRAPTPKDLISTAYHAYTTGIVARSAAILGRTSDARRYAALQRRIVAAFNREFVSPAGRVTGDTQTGYLLALGFGLLPRPKRAYAVNRLVRDIEVRGWHLSTGFVGTPLLAPVLSAVGRTDVAYKLLLQQSYPSWLFMVKQGATTMWERWNGYSRERGFSDPGMTSFNHYAYGAIGEWLYSTVAGIDLDTRVPGYKRIVFRPQPGPGITRASGRLETRYGLVACRWEVRGGRMNVDVTVPPNTTGTVCLPGRKPCTVRAGSHRFCCSAA